MLTSLAPSPMARVMLFLCRFIRSTTSAFCRGVTRQHITALHMQPTSSNNSSNLSVSAWTCRTKFNTITVSCWTCSNTWHESSKWVRIVVEQRWHFPCCALCSVRTNHLPLPSKACGNWYYSPNCDHLWLRQIRQKAPRLCWFPGMVFPFHRDRWQTTQPPCPWCHLPRQHCRSWSVSSLPEPEMWEKIWSEKPVLSESAEQNLFRKSFSPPRDKV